MVEAMLTHHDSGRKYKRAAGALATTLVALIACVFGTAYLADDVTKEVRLSRVRRPRVLARPARQSGARVGGRYAHACVPLCAAFAAVSPRRWSWARPQTS